MADAVGVDGCRGGWVAAEVHGREVAWRCFRRFADVLEAYPRTVIAVDTPIGLEIKRPRRADQEARRWLSQHGGSGSSVFPSPRTGHLEMWRNDSLFSAGLGISAQTWNILDKIADVESCGVGPGNEWVFEAHPECSFRAMSPSTSFAPKKRLAGVQQRATVLGTQYQLPLSGRLVRKWTEDAVDATAIAWTAAHARLGAQTFPADPAPNEPVITV